ncbi:hypothetical protein ABEB36_003159 [Hypothenemus hampei]|uniref:ascorbate ferrireductase (transmembrane) n=1 Tax=Hypothenemus hampei TaxID=57062 RepID=A0ABD1F888_HYPHA
MTAPHTTSYGQRAFLVLQSIFHLLLAIFITSTIWFLAYNWSWNNLRTWHVFLCNIGISLFMAEGIALFNPGNAFIYGSSRKFRGTLHGIFMGLGALAVIVGVSMMINYKISNNRTHLTTPHAIIGITTFIITFLAAIGGIFIHFYDRFNIKPVYVKNCHFILGILVYVLGVITLSLGLKNYFYENSDATNTGLIVILVLASIINVSGPLKSLFKL